MNNTLNQVAGAIGTALLVTIMTNRTASQAKELGAAAMKHLTTPPTQAGMAEMKQQIMTQAMLNGINYSFLITTFIAVVAFVLAFFIKRAHQAKEPTEGSHSNPSSEKIRTKLVQN